LDDSFKIILSLGRGFQLIDNIFREQAIGNIKKAGGRRQEAGGSYVSP
jgi:hypothetical protein